MAHVTRIPFARHLRARTTTHVRHMRRGRVAHEGTGVAFWYRPLTAVLTEVPVDDRELPLLFHVRTADFQDLTVQATVTYRVTDPGRAAEHIDFDIDADTGRWRGQPLELLGGLLTETAQQHALDWFATVPLATALVDGVAAARERMEAGLADDPRLVATGVTVMGVRVVAVRPEPDLERALQTPTREEVQQEADRATYERRAVAVERERAIAENELANQIELARREEQLVTQRGTNARRQAEEAAAADEIETVARAAREKRLAQARATATVAVGEAEATAEQARMAAYATVDQATLLALALRELAGNLPQIDHLVVTPDLLTNALAQLTARPAAAPTGGER